MPAVQHWGRKESLIWPPRGSIYTIGASLVALLATILLIYVRYERGFTPLQKYYLPYYVRSELAGELHTFDNYQLLYIADGRSLRRLALESDVEPGATLQVRGRPVPLQLTSQEAKNGSIFLTRGPLSRYSNKGLHSWLAHFVYGDVPVYKSFSSQLWLGLVSLGCCYRFPSPKTLRAAKNCGTEDASRDRF